MNCTEALCCRFIGPIFGTNKIAECRLEHTSAGLLDCLTIWRNPTSLSPCQSSCSFILPRIRNMRKLMDHHWWLTLLFSIALSSFNPYFSGYIQLVWCCIFWVFSPIEPIFLSRSFTLNHFVWSTSYLCGNYPSEFRATFLFIIQFQTNRLPASSERSKKGCEMFNILSTPENWVAGENQTRINQLHASDNNVYGWQSAPECCIGTVNRMILCLENNNNNNNKLKTTLSQP